MVLALAVIVIGIYMVANFESMTAPFISGIAFILTGMNLWLPNCPMCNHICKAK